MARDAARARAVIRLGESAGENGRAALKSADSCLVGDQRNWLRQRDACKDAACLRQTYLNRLAELDPLQPGVTRIKNIELPAVNALVWIVPAALDEVAAPVNKQAKPASTANTIRIGSEMCLQEYIFKNILSLSLSLSFLLIFFPFDDEE